jgi:hypothetical protein
MRTWRRLTWRGLSAALPFIEHRPTVIDTWARDLRKRFDGRPVVVCLELWWSHDGRSAR